jgi:protein xylosyltransferase
MHNLQRLLAPMSNVVVADNDNRYSTIWAGASLLQMMLSSIRYINKSIWHNSWDYLLNLSESDMPILTLAEIESVLNKFVI